MRNCGLNCVGMQTFHQSLIPRSGPSDTSLVTRVGAGGGGGSGRKDVGIRQETHVVLVPQGGASAGLNAIEIGVQGGDEGVGEGSHFVRRKARGVARIRIDD